MVFSVRLVDKGVYRLRVITPFNWQYCWNYRITGTRINSTWSAEVNIIYALCFYAFVIFAVINNIGMGSSEFEDTPLNFNKMKTMELRRFLADRGLACKGCSEKNEFVQMAESNKDLPVIVKEPVEEKKKDKDVDIDELMQKLKGFGGANVFTADDIKNMNFEDMMKKKGGSRTNKGSGSGRSKTANTPRDIPEGDEDKIEL